MSALTVYRSLRSGAKRPRSAGGSSGSSRASMTAMARVRIPRPLKDRGVYRFLRVSTPLKINMNSSTGFAGSNSYGIGIQYELAKMSTTRGNSTFSGQAELSSLFDSYRITSVKLVVCYSNSDTSTAAYERPVFFIANDYNDAAQPASADVILQRGVYRSMQLGGTPQRHRCRPQVAVSAFEGAFTGYAEMPKGQWLNSSYATIQHFGTKLWWNNFRTDNLDIGTVQLYCEAMIECKNQA